MLLRKAKRIKQKAKEWEKKETKEIKAEKISCKDLIIRRK